MALFWTKIIALLISDKHRPYSHVKNDKTLTPVSSHYMHVSPNGITKQDTDNNQCIKRKLKLPWIIQSLRACSLLPTCKSLGFWEETGCTVCRPSQFKKRQRFTNNVVHVCLAVCSCLINSHFFWIWCVHDQGSAQAACQRPFTVCAGEKTLRFKHGSALAQYPMLQKIFRSRKIPAWSTISVLPCKSAGGISGEWDRNHPSPTESRGQLEALQCISPCCTRAASGIKTVVIPCDSVWFRDNSAGKASLCDLVGET